MDEWTNKLKIQWAEPVSLTFHSVLGKLYTEHSIWASYQNRFILVSRFQRKIFCLEIDQSETRIACGGHVCKRIGNKRNNLYRGPSIDASYKGSVHLTKRFQRKRFFFRNRPIRNKNCLWLYFELRNLTVMSNIYRRPSIDASHQVMVHLAKRFQRRRFF